MTLRRVGVAVLLAVAALVIWLLPPRAVVSPAPQWAAPPTLRGAYHIHSAASDGTGSIEEIAAAAARAGLHFIVLTDHGNGTRPPLPPEYRSGVLCLDGVEISTQFGHLVAIGMPQAPYPLAGHPRDVLEDVTRLGGAGFAAHPGSPKEALRWHDWETPVDGLEWLNADSEWRDELWSALGKGLLTYGFRSAETLASLLDRPTEVIQQWQRLTRKRRVVALAAADAHARLGLKQSTDPYSDRVLARLPSYEVSFRAFSNHVVLERALTKTPSIDAQLVTDAIRAGRVFTTIDGLATLGALEATVTSGSNSARFGDYLDLRGPATLRARWAAPDGTAMTVLKDGQPIHTASNGSLSVELDNAPAVYRLEARLASQHGESTVPWLFTNPFYVGMRAAHEAAAARPAENLSKGIKETTSLLGGDWQPEQNPGSESRIAVGSGQAPLDWHFTLAGGVPHAQYAAMRIGLGKMLTAHERLRLRARANRPMRIWIQLRAPSTRLGERWGRTVYLDQQARDYDFDLDDFRPIGTVSQPRPPLDGIDGLLLVVDTLNSLPASSGVITIEELALKP